MASSTTTTQPPRRRSPPPTATTTTAATATDCDVLVVGAGASGIGAARCLAAAGLKVVVLEARKRTGGRVYTDTSLGCPCDLGGQWIHQYGSLNPFKALVESEGIPYKKARGGREWHVVDGETTVKYTSSELALARGLRSVLLGEVRHEAASLRASGEDKAAAVAYHEAYRQAVLGGDGSDTPKTSTATAAAGATATLPRTRERRLLDWVLRGSEFFEGASFQTLSCTTWDSGGELPGHNQEVEMGYGAFVQHLGAGLDVRLQQVVTSIEYDKSKQLVSVTASDANTAKAKKGKSSTFTARAVVVTLPLGVLQDNAVTFTPTLPPSKLAAIDRLGVAVMNKVVLAFDTRFWGSKTSVIGVASDDVYSFPWFLCDRAATATSPHTLVAFLATEHCVKLEALSDEELVSRAMAKLAAAFPEQCTSATSAGVGAASSAGGGAGASTSTSTGESKPAATVNAHGLPQPVGWLVTRWRSDPFARGAWTCYTVGCRGPSDALELAKPVDGCLFFAGEATEPRAQGTAHGAYMSGQRAAKEVLAALSV